MTDCGTEEGDVCNRDGCEGIMWLPPVTDCSCHISPPCAQCERNAIVCNECGSDPFDDDYISPEDQKRNTAMERGDYLRDRAKDEKE